MDHFSVRFQVSSYGSKMAVNHFNIYRMISKVAVNALSLYLQTSCQCGEVLVVMIYVCFLRKEFLRQPAQCISCVLIFEGGHRSRFLSTDTTSCVKEQQTTIHRCVVVVELKHSSPVTLHVKMRARGGERLGEDCQRH